MIKLPWDLTAQEFIWAGIKLLQDLTELGLNSAGLESNIAELHHA